MNNNKLVKNFSKTGKTIKSLTMYMKIKAKIDLDIVNINCLK